MSLRQLKILYVVGTILIPMGWISMIISSPLIGVKIIAAMFGIGSLYLLGTILRGIIRQERYEFRKANNLCKHCGYDFKHGSNPWRCPECGNCPECENVSTCDHLRL
jgi:hypothetical protein